MLAELKTIFIDRTNTFYYITVYNEIYARNPLVYFKPTYFELDQSSQLSVRLLVNNQFILESLKSRYNYIVDHIDDDPEEIVRSFINRTSNLGACGNDCVPIDFIIEVDPKINLEKCVRVFDKLKVRKNRKFGLH